MSLETRYIIVIEDGIGIRHNSAGIGLPLIKLARVYKPKDRGFGKPNWPSANQKQLFAFAADTQEDLDTILKLWIDRGMPENPQETINADPK